MFRSGLVDTLVTHDNIKGVGLTPLSGDHHGYMPPLVKTKECVKSNFLFILAIIKLVLQVAASALCWAQLGQEGRHSWLVLILVGTHSNQYRQQRLDPA